MLFMNDKQNSYGYFSQAGIRSTKVIKLLFCYEKKKSLGKSSHSKNSKSHNKIKNKNKYHSKINDFDIFTVEEPDKENLDDIAKDIIKNPITKKSSINKYNNKSNENEIKSKYFFHINHKQKPKKKEIVPSCTKYNPKYDAILKRNASTPLWKTITGRKKTTKDFYDFPFYLNQELIQNNMAGKSFVDFSKQTIRKCFYANNKNSNINEKNSNLNIENTRPLTCKNKSIIINKKMTNNINKDKDKNDTSISNDSFEKFKNEYTKQLIKNKLEIQKRKEKEKEELKRKVKSINFNQILSREALDEIENSKKEVVPYLLPNYKSIIERPVMMVVYNRKKNKIKKTKSEIISKIDNFMNYEKKNLHIRTPNFDLMTSRPYDEKGPLPSYMRKIYDKNSCDKITGESLILNNYSHGGFSQNKSSFLPKNSFNKLINLNLIKSKKNFYKALLFNNIKNNKKYKILEKSLDFYSKNFLDLENTNNIKIPIRELIKKFKKGG